MPNGIWQTKCPKIQPWSSSDKNQTSSQTATSDIENDVVNKYSTPTPQSSPTASPMLAESKSQPSASAVFDIPLLLNKNKDEVNALLGTPARETNYETDPNEIDNQKLDFGYIGIDVATVMKKEQIFKELNLDPANTQYIIGIRRFPSEPKNINQVYVFPAGSKYYNPADFTE